MTYKLPERGFVFWPVGNGDCTTVVVSKDRILQFDVNHLEASDDESDPRIPVIDKLVKLFPKINGKPYLSVFALSHPDQDHCKGFAELLKRVHIGELWLTPRIFREYKKTLCDDANAFNNEATRRIKKIISSNGDVESGNRLRLIGYDELLKEDEFKGFPRSFLSIPGDSIVILDGMNCGDKFQAYIHAPFKEDLYGDRNEASLALQVTLKEKEKTAQAILFGDLRYPNLIKIFERNSNRKENLKWNIILAPHHCSKSAMYWKDEEDSEEELKQDILNNIEENEVESGYVIASSSLIPSQDKEGDDPPHAIAKERYQEVASNGFLCTQEYPTKEKPEPIIFEFGKDSLSLIQDSKTSSNVQDKVADALKGARGEEPPNEKVGFGE